MLGRAITLAMDDKGLVCRRGRGMKLMPLKLKLILGPEENPFR